MEEKKTILNIDDTPYSTYDFERKSPGTTHIESNAREILTEIPGVIRDIRVKPGNRISAGDTLYILDAMKTHNHIQAEFPGTVKEIMINTGDKVKRGQLVITVEPA